MTLPVCCGFAAGGEGFCCDWGWGEGGGPDADVAEKANTLRWREMRGRNVAEKANILGWREVRGRNVAEKANTLGQRGAYERNVIEKANTLGWREVRAPQPVTF
ncbi:hypothetical protein [Paenibacillus silagei]|uniref:Uncharacterized protein n=1 Tax=Paenibacillus silagei TaxID=1670801 RepID=A0ABS4NYK5_9BACL|nr:hypothetical protein [Paenibacillus silagei]MBP2114546.1 hypothetical protein [Paenibacillus silagei]